MAARPCLIEGCEKPTGVPGTARGWCSTHYNRWVSHGDPLKTVRKRNTCTVDGCDSFCAGRGLCTKHWERWRRSGETRMRGEVIDGKKICPGCGEDKPVECYTGRPKGRCKRCRADIRNDWRRANPNKLPPRKPTRPKTCDACGAVFQANKRRRRYCSAGCFESHRNKANWPHMAKRRARLREALIEQFDRVEIFERDRWTCGICNEPVDRGAVAPHPSSPSIDHIVPIARGGMHERANVQCAHLGCNVRKGVSVEGGAA